MPLPVTAPCPICTDAHDLFPPYFCEDHARSHGYLLRCAVCGREWRTRRASLDRIHLCSDECRRQWNNRKRHVVHTPMACARCGTTFTPTRSDAKYCSTRCRVAAHRGGTGN